MGRRILKELFGITEMPRPAGTFGPQMKAVFDWAAKKGGPFTARDAYPIWRQAGGQPNQPDEHMAYISFSQMLRKAAAEPGMSPDAVRPLVTVRPGTRGIHGAAVFQHMNATGGKRTRSAVGTGPQAPQAPQGPERLGKVANAAQRFASASKAPEPAADDDFGGEEPTQPDAVGSGMVPHWASQEHEPEEPEAQAAAEPGEGDLDQGDEEEPEPTKDQGGGDYEDADDEDWPDWLPYPDEDGSRGERAMDRVIKAGVSATDEIWDQIAGADDAVEVQKIIRTSRLPKNVDTSMLNIAREIFQRRGKEWG